MRPSLVLATVAALAVGLLAPAGAGAVPASRVTPPRIGQAGPAVAVCNATAPAAVLAGGSAGPAYVAPVDGVVTGFSHQANGTAGQVRALVLADAPSTSNKIVVAKSAKMTVSVNKLNAFGVQLRMRAGERLALWYSTNLMACLTVGTAGDTSVASAPFDADVNPVFAPTGSFVGSYRPNIAASFEPDADGDGFGDYTQDACPRSALTTAVCPEPDTRITRKPKHASTRHKVKVTIRFTSSIAGSTFQCRLDGHKKWKRCSSPFKRTLGIGKHRLQVRAVSPQGVPDRRPATARFTITKAKRHR
ncbi:hypothetical protein [Nocardioides halotolerans]|uniref:hypothetical protein n=1 Tax=Nocardioides halotolerans TaxID=433660 RepID=UPI0012F7B677|nr:hypothetical protein [Nocardioides halotolerans]